MYQPPCYQLTAFKFQQCDHSRFSTLFRNIYNYIFIYRRYSSFMI